VRVWSTSETSTSNLDLEILLILNVPKELSSFRRSSLGCNIILSLLFLTGIPYGSYSIVKYIDVVAQNNARNAIFVFFFCLFLVKTKRLCHVIKSSFSSGPFGRSSPRHLIAISLHCTFDESNRRPTLVCVE
jgi:hypothetical protein